MNDFNCRTEKRRVELIKIYEFVPISHMILLQGQEKHSAAEQKITKEYYCFSYKNKTIENDKGTFFVGTPVANHFLKLLKLKPLLIFNPLKCIKKYKKRTNNESELVENINNNWNELALELFKIINILLMAWDINEGILADILLNIRKYYYKEPFFSNIKSVNTIIKKYEEKNKKNRNIFGILNDFKIMGNDIKEYDFPLITKILLENGIKNYITSNGT